MKYPGLRDWEWMIRTAAQPERPAHEDDDFSDIWENSRSGRNPAAEQWLNDNVDYSQEGSRPTDWVGRPRHSPPSYQDLQQDGEESNRTIDGSHNAFQDAYYNGLEDNSYEGQFGVAGPPPESYEPTSSERLASDEGWLLGPNKTFDWPGGRDKYEAIHNGMHQRGFDLDNDGTDENPSPAYVHRETGARIRPSVDEITGEPTWGMMDPVSGITEHAGPTSAAALHEKNVADRNAAEAARWRSTSDSQRSRQPAPGAGPRRRESPDYIPKTKAKALGWRELFSQAIHGNQGAGREFERASVKSVLDPFRSETGRLYGVHKDQWNQDFENGSSGRGKVSQAIYHYATPIAWKYHEAQPDGTYDEGTWRQPATTFGSGGFFSTGRVQNLMSGAFHGTNHGFLRDPLVEHRIHRALEDGGFHRQPDQSYQAVDNHGNTHNLAPSQSGKTIVHTVTRPGPEGRTFTKRLSAQEAAQNAYAMTQAPGAGGPSDPVAFLQGKKYRDSQPPSARRRLDVPLRIQPELPFRNSSVASWSELLRN